MVLAQISEQKIANVPGAGQNVRAPSLDKIRREVSAALKRGSIIVNESPKGSASRPSAPSDENCLKVKSSRANNLHDIRQSRLLLQK